MSDFRPLWGGGHIYLTAPPPMYLGFLWVTGFQIFLDALASLESMLESQWVSE